MRTTEAIRQLDLHERNVYQARVAVKAALRRAGGLYRIRVVHGYRHGTAIRDMLYADMAAHAGVLRLERINDGTTDIVLRELVK